MHSLVKTKEQTSISGQNTWIQLSHGVDLYMFISLYSSVSTIVVCVFLCRPCNEVRIPYAINLSDRTSTSSTDATFVVVDLQTAGYIYLQFIPPQISHICFVIYRFR
jgi:hypothetical protein